MAIKKLAILGCGHIGGSVALALKAAGAVECVVGYDRLPEALAQARALGICDETAASAREAVNEADTVILAVPVRSIPPLAKEIAPAVAPGTVVADVGSTKKRIVAECEEVLRSTGAHFVGAHPLAGTERAGPKAAIKDLFQDKVVLVTSTEQTNAHALERVRKLWEAVGAAVREIDAAAHDRIMAAVSHLPHVVGYTMVGALGRRGVEDLVGLTGGGFLDSTRIVSTPPAMWVDVFLENREELLPLLGGFAAQLQALRKAMEQGDAEAIGRLLSEARTARHKILGED